MHARFTRSAIVTVLAAILAWIPSLSEVARAGEIDKVRARRRRALDLAAGIHADRPARHGPARGHRTGLRWLGAGPDALGRVGQLEPVGRDRSHPRAG